MTLTPTMQAALTHIREHSPPVAYVSGGTAKALARRGLIECFMFHGVPCWRVTPSESSPTVQP